MNYKLVLNNLWRYLPSIFYNRSNKDVLACVKALIKHDNFDDYCWDSHSIQIKQYEWKYLHKYAKEEYEKLKGEPK